MFKRKYIFNPGPFSSQLREFTGRSFVGIYSKNPRYQNEEAWLRWWFQPNTFEKYYIVKLEIIPNFQGEKKIFDNWENNLLANWVVPPDASGK